MNWWYRHVFLDRNTPLNRETVYDRQQPEVQTKSNLYSRLTSAGSWLKAKYLEHAQLRYDWRIYKNLTDHQLKDIGLTRHDLHLLLKNKTPVIPQQRLHTTRSVNTQHHHPQLTRDSELNKPDTEVCHGVCSNDYVADVA